MQVAGDREIPRQPHAGSTPSDYPAREPSVTSQGVPVASARAAMRILVVSSVRLVRDGLAMLLERRPRVEAVRLVRSAEDAVLALRTFSPTLILLDVAGRDGLAAAERLGPRADGVQIVGFAAGEQERDVLAYAAAGIAAFIPREASIDEVFATVDRAADGELLCSPRVAGAMFRNLATLTALTRTTPATAEAALTGREREIVRCIDEGMSNKEIARLLRIGVSTVKNHVHNILEKLGVSRRSEAAARLRGVDPEPRRSEAEI
jgi:two-component system, NarL family, nitrate/nitrite response regulator NarL